MLSEIFLSIGNTTEFIINSLKSLVIIVVFSKDSALKKSITSLRVWMNAPPLEAKRQNVTKGIPASAKAV